MERVAIITPVMNGKRMTEMYLSALIRLYGDDDNVLIIIIDNNSGDDTPELLTRFAADNRNVRVITNHYNAGYGVACNQGADLAADEFRGGEFILLFMNNDVVIGGDFLMVTRKMVTMFPADLFGAAYYPGNTGWNKFGNMIIPYLEGWFLAMSESLFRSVGGFDPRFSPCDYEDVDLSMTVSSIGGALRQLRVPVRHIGNQTGATIDSRVKITEKNRKLFSEKWGLT